MPNRQPTTFIKQDGVKISATDRANVFNLITIVLTHQTSLHKFPKTLNNKDMT